LPFLQVHQQERKIIEDIDTGKLTAELDAVEQHRLAANQADIPQMQVAMAKAHAPLRPAPVEQAAHLPHGDLRTLPERLDIRQGENAGCVNRKIEQVAGDDVRDRSGTARLEVHFRGVVEIRDFTREL